MSMNVVIIMVIVNILVLTVKEVTVVFVIVDTH